jgi:prepilin-type N-terminal cleavage/methylation domain-containing protein
MRRDAGFTLIEVMVSMLIGTVGLLGTIAVQQSIISASKNANDAAVAMRLASQKLEELSSRNTDNPNTDKSAMGLGLYPLLGGWSPRDASGATLTEYVDAEGVVPRDSSGYATVPQPTDMARYRWRRQWKVTDTGTLSPYVISVIVTYNNDVGDAKTTRLDLERRKSW